MERCPFCILYTDINTLAYEEVTHLTRLQDRCECGAVLFYNDGKYYVCREIRHTIYGPNGIEFISGIKCYGDNPYEKRVTAISLPRTV